jgi:hypothetical protein
VDHEALLRLINAPSRGKRPYFFEHRDTDRLLSIVWALAAELAVTRERLDTVERLLARRDVLEREAIESFEPTPDDARERGEWHIEYLSRLLRGLQQEIEALKRDAAEQSAEDVARDVASQ